MKKYFLIGFFYFFSIVSQSMGADEATQRLFDTWQPVVLCTMANSLNINSEIHSVSSGRDYIIVGQPVMSSVSGGTGYTPIVCVVIQRK